MDWNLGNYSKSSMGGMFIKILTEMTLLPNSGTELSTDVFASQKYQEYFSLLPYVRSN